MHCLQTRSSSAESGPISPPALSFSREEEMVYHTCLEGTDGRAEQRIDSSLVFLLISFLSSIWQNGSHFMSEKERQPPTDRWASELDGHLARAGVPWCFHPHHAQLSSSNCGQEWLTLLCMKLQGTWAARGHHSWLRGLQSDEKGKNTRES